MRFDEFDINISYNGINGEESFHLDETHKLQIVLMVLQDHFACARCGACCTTATPYIAVYEVDIPPLAKDLGISKKKFKRKYLSRVKEHTPEGLAYYRMKLPCPFYNYDVGNGKGGCTIYDKTRPIICRIHPIADKYIPGMVEYMWGVCEERDCPGMKETVGTTPEKWLIMKIKKENNCDDETATNILEEEMLNAIDKYMKTLERLDKLHEIGIRKIMKE